MHLTPSDVYINLIKEGASEELATALADIVRKTRVQAQYELYKNVKYEQKDYDNIISFEQFLVILNQGNVSSLFEKKS